MKHFYRLLNYGTLIVVRVLFLFLVTGDLHAQTNSQAVAMAESIIKNHPGSYRDWDYVTGTVLRGYQELWKITAEKKYYDYIKNTVDLAVTSGGTISGYTLSDYNIDEIKEGCQVLFLYRETGMEKYKKAAELLRSQLDGHPRTSEGAFWHKQRYPWQIWLDGLYMGSPFYAEYGEVFDEPAAADDVALQLLLTHKHLRDSVTGLYYHGWDEKRQQEWADTVTGRSPSFWGRAMGWYAMALVDALDYLPAGHVKRDSIVMILNLFAPAIRNYQDSASGVWWQVTDQGPREGNYLESSASCMFVYALAKAARMGYIDTSYRSVAIRGFNGILKEFITVNTNGTLTLGKTCLTAGLGNGRDGSYDYYVYETTVVSNDGKALGPFMLAAIEIENPVYPPAGLKQDTSSAAFHSVFLQQKESPYYIPVEVTNQVMAGYSDLPVVIDLKQLKQQVPAFDPAACIVLSGEKEIPAQVNDIENDGQPDELVFTVGFKAGETRRYMLTGKTGERVSPAPVKRTQAEISHKTGGHWDGRKYTGGEFVHVNFIRVPDEHTDHSFYIRYEGPGWESDKVGYRFYLDWRNAIDIFGKLTDTLVLQHVGLDGFDSYHEPAAWGMDVFKVGKTLGLGSVALWKNDSVYMVSNTDSVTCRIALNGPVESMIETKYYGWNVDNTRNDLTSRLSIYAGSRVTEHHLELIGDGGTFCTGLIKDKKAELILSPEAKDGWAYMATWGCQSLNNDSLGIAILYNTANLAMITEDPINHIVVLKPENNILHYNLVAAWEKEPGGIKTKAEFMAWLNSLIAILNHPLIIKF